MCASNWNILSSTEYSYRNQLPSKDRQANDNNGNCEDPSDMQCVDANPADNTDLCYVRNGSNHVSLFPNDDNNEQPYRAEAPIHCHGFAWEDDANDSSGVYKANNLFFVSMYDHLYQRGYVKEVPGAPMCGCSEQMPVVSRADCTQLEVVQSFQFEYDGTSFTANVADVSIEFKSCTGIDQFGEEDENDLWSHVNRLYIEGKMAEKNLVALTGQLVGDSPNQCHVAQKAVMAAGGYITGYAHDKSKWLKVAGRDAMMDGIAPYGLASFAEVMKSSSTKILRRVCSTCYASHQNIFYKRLTPVPVTLDIIEQLTNGIETPEELAGIQFGIDFQLYSTYEDAANGVNPWVCSPEDGYRYTVGFPGDCGPADVGETQYQSSVFNWESPKYNVAFYIDSVDTFNSVASTTIGSGITPSGKVRSFLGRSFTKDNKIYLQDTGGDLWGEDTDQFTFKYEKTTGDVEITVKVETLDYTDNWTKAGLMIRASLGSGAKYFAVLLSGMNGDLVQYRAEDNSWTHSEGHEWTDDIDPKPMWLRIFKQGTTFTAFTSLDGSDWSQKTESVQIDITGDIYVGLVLCADSWDGDLAEAVFSNYDSEAYIWPSPAPSSSPAPTTFSVISSDIGDVNVDFPGKASFGKNSNVYTITAAGQDVWGTEDSFHFINQQRSGDFTVSALVSNVLSENEWVKAGVMIRASTAANAPHMMSVFSNKYGGYKLWRQVASGETDSSGINWESAVAQKLGWVRVQRKGDTFTGFKSFDGIHWIQVNEPVKITMPSQVQVGLALCSANNWEYATVTFQHFEIA
jgi:regulation of enolase protein 1 (concanavalin A-like superfamily)